MCVCDDSCTVSYRALGFISNRQQRALGERFCGLGLRDCETARLFQEQEGVVGTTMRAFVSSTRQTEFIAVAPLADAHGRPKTAASSEYEHEESSDEEVDAAEECQYSVSTKRWDISRFSKGKGPPFRGVGECLQRTPLM